MTYTHDQDPLRSLSDTIAFSSADFAAERDRAWIYGIVLGWDCDQGVDPRHVHDEHCDAAMRDISVRYGWNPVLVARLRHLHQRFSELAAAEVARGIDLHLRTELHGRITISTMFDGENRPGSGPFETLIFGTGRDDNPVFHWRTPAMAESAHWKFVAVLAGSR